MRHDADLAEAVRRRVLERLDATSEATVTLLQALVQRPSPSHAEGRADDATSVVGHLAGAIAGRASRVEVEALGPRSANVMEVVHGDPDGRVLLLAAHTDTVPEGDPASWLPAGAAAGALGRATWLGDGRVTLEVDGRTVVVTLRSRMAEVWQRRGWTERRIVYGRGAFDDKGAVAALAAAMGAVGDACRAVRARLGGDLVAAYTADEEQDSTGIRRLATDPASWLARNGFLRADRGKDGLRAGITGMALEGSYGWAPVVGHRGGLHLALSVRGAATHASTPDLGVNAVLGMTEVLRCLEDGRRAPGGLLGLAADGLLGTESVAVGTTLAGGGIRAVRRDGDGTHVDREGLNVVPDWCEATADIRFPPLPGVASGSADDTPERITRAVRAFLDRHLVDRPYRVDVAPVPGTYMPAVAMAADWSAVEAHPLVERTRAIAGSVLGVDPGIAVAPGGSDATFLVHEAGIPSLVELGPAGGRSHDVHEFVDLGDVLDGARILALLAIDHLGVQPSRGADD